MAMPTSFPVLQNMSEDELLALWSSEEDAQAFVENLDYVKKRKQHLETLRATERESGGIGDTNSKKQKVVSLQLEIGEVKEDIAVARAQLEGLSAQTDSLRSLLSHENIVIKIHSEIHDLEAISDASTDSLREGSIANLDVFLTDFINLRKTHHRRVMQLQALESHQFY